MVSQSKNTRTSSEKHLYTTVLCCLIIGVLVSAFSIVLIGSCLLNFPDFGAVLRAPVYGIFILCTAVPIGITMSTYTHLQIKRFFSKVSDSKNNKYYYIARIGIILCFVPLVSIFIEILFAALLISSF